MENIHLVGVCGSLRAGSFNTMLLKACLELLPENTSMEFAPIHDIPLYNADFDTPTAAGRPPSVVRFRDQLAQADGLVIASPEYNYSIPGGLKNAIDWASRGEDAPLIGKPVALMGATPGLWGTVRMQTAFLPLFQYLDMKPVYKPEILLAQAGTKFDAQGELTDKTARELIRKKLQHLKAVIEKAKG